MRKVWYKDITYHTPIQNLVTGRHIKSQQKISEHIYLIERIFQQERDLEVLKS